jgi:photosystem II stability/assembly factor-like uncharacterized protein
MKTSRLFLLLSFISVLSSMSFAQWIKQVNGVPDSATWGAGWAIDAVDKDNAIFSLSYQMKPNVYTSVLSKTTDGGLTWIKLNSPETLKGDEIIDISMIDKMNIWYCTGYGKISYSSDGGSNWTLQFYDTLKTVFFDYIKMFDLNNGIAMGDGKDYNKGPALFLKTTNGGKNWISVNDSAFGGSSGSIWQRLDFPSPQVGYFYESGSNPQYLYKTTNGGSKWTKIENISFVLDIKFYDEKIGICVSSKTCKTTDGGASWTAMNIPYNYTVSTWPADIEFAKNDPTKIWITDSRFLYYSSDAGNTWIIQNTFPKFGVRDIVFVDDKNGWILTDYGVYHTVTGGQPINLVNSRKIAEDFYLFQNFPNPFNNSTIIKYYLNKESNVKLKIYDILGKEISTLVNGHQPSGSYSVPFNAENLPGGIYVYKLMVDDNTMVKKLLYLK